MSTARRPPLVAPECLPGASTPGICDRCCKALTGRRKRWCSDKCSWDYTNNHVYQFARHKVRQRDKSLCVLCKIPGAVETDHIVAARGSHAQHSCVHHMDNLRCLCVPCHKERTREQRQK